MTRGRDTDLSGVAGGPAPHIPVLAARVIEHLAPRDGATYVDATFGAGGHTRLILEAANCRVIALDRDPTVAKGAARFADAFGARFAFAPARFSELEAVLTAKAVRAVDGVLIDLGVSSMQLDTPARGFSFRADGPLDMRMGQSRVSAADVVAKAGERDLAAIIRLLGEERHAGRVARAIVRARERAPIATTRQLAELVASVVRHKPGEIHPATRTFQALRMFVNEELDELAAALAGAERVLAPGGCLLIISFHSLEDRLVKRFLALRSRAPAVSRHEPVPASAPSSFRLLTSRPVIADAAEIAANPRARSAKLRAAERTDAPALRQAFDAAAGLPSLSDLERRR